MTARRAALGVLVGILALATTANATPRGAPGAVFRVRPDARMCPSPICGGFWVSRVNRTTTACADGMTRAWCYVAEIDRARAPSAGRTGTFLVRGRIAPGTGDSRPLGRLVATESWIAATPASWSGAVYLVTDSGIRCIRAPCPSFRASTVNTSRSVLASGLDLSGVPVSRAVKQKAREEVTNGGLLVAGKLRYLSDVTRVVVVTEFFLPA